MIYMSKLLHGDPVDKGSKYIQVRSSSCPKTRNMKLILIAVAMMLPGWILSQAVAAEDTVTESKKTTLSQEKLDSLLAPIALYPDQLLTQALMASTYPLDIVEAARFVKANKELKGEELDKAVLEKKWDPSVQSLTAFPQVLEMMNDKLEWTQELGDAFLSDEKRVMQTVQGLRQKAEAAGNLKSNEQQKIVKEKTVIIIEPAETEVVYVPTYNPTVVYGTWWAPMYPPYYWPPPPYYYPGYHAGGAFVIGFSIGMIVSSNHWGWCHPHWRGGSVNININKNNVFINKNNDFKKRVNNGSWKHNPSQRKGVAYRDAATREQFRKVDANAVSARREVRGFEPGNSRVGDRSQAGGSKGKLDLTRPADRAIDSGRPGNLNSGTTRELNRPADRSAGSDRPGNLNSGTTREFNRPADRSAPGNLGDRGNRSFNRSSDTRPSFDANHSRQQTRDFSNRGASSRATGGGGARSLGGRR